MGTVVRGGDGEGVVVATGLRTEFGQIAAGLSERQEETEFQVGLRHFSVLLVQVAGVLTSSIFVVNLLLERPLLESLLFSLAIAVGITPQLLPAVVTTSLATGSRRLARQGVLVKRLVCIEDLGDIEILLTDKTGTLTEGHISFLREPSLPPASDDPDVFGLGLLCNDAIVEDEPRRRRQPARRGALGGPDAPHHARLDATRRDGAVRSRPQTVLGPGRGR